MLCSKQARHSVMSKPCGHLLHGGSGGSKGWPGELESPFELLHLLLTLAGRPEVRVPQGLHEAHNVMCRPKLQVGFINLHTAAQQVRPMHQTSCT